MGSLPSLAAAILLLPGNVPRAFAYPNDLTKWVVVKPPRAWDERSLFASADVMHQWFVTLRDGRPMARPESLKGPAPPPLPFTIKEGTSAEGLAGRRLGIQVDDGWIVAFNAGEWGGWLWWFSPDGTRHYQIAADCWVNGFILTDAGLFVAEGISHGRSRGTIVRLAHGQDRRWHSRVFVALDEEAYCAAKDADGTLVVATYGRLLRVHPETRKVDVLVGNAFWSALYPTSMVIARRGDIYLGMRHGVARIERKGRAYRVDWLLPVRDYDRTARSTRGMQ